MDVAWSAILDLTPTLADPTRYKRAMYTVIWEGKEPELTPEERQAAREHAAADAKADIGRPAGGSDLAALNRLESFAAKLRAQKEGEDPN
jgi:hypothetical protein